MKTAIFLIAILCSIHGYAQVEDFTFSPPSLTEPSPEAFGLGKYGFLSPDKYTGAISKSIPLYEIDFDGLKIPITLNYHSSGHRPREEATWVGLGWSLTSHAVITRRVYGGDDFLKDRQGNEYGWIYTNPFLPTHNPSSAGSSAWILDQQTESILRNTASSSFYRPDLEQDIYSVNLFGKSIRFVIGKYDNVNDVIDGIALNDQLLKIQFSESSQTFKIIDEKGFKYFFNNKMSGRSFPGGMSRNQIMSWNINKIESPLGNILNFNYIFPLPIMIQSVENQVDVKNIQYYIFGSGIPPQIPSSYVNRVYSRTQENYLASITSTNTRIVFYTSDRKDIQVVGNEYAQKLDSICVEYRYIDSNNNFVYEPKRSFRFLNSYFRSDMINDPDASKYLRLRLDAFEFEGKKYEFIYEGDDQVNNLPNKETLAVDYWGYFNGMYHVNSLTPPFSISTSSGNLNTHGFKREGDAFFARRGVLKKIIYPTSGWTSFELEPHIVQFPVNTVYNWENYDPTMYSGQNKRNKQIGGLRVSKIEDFDSDGSIVGKKEYDYTEPNSILSSGILKNENFEYTTQNELFHTYMDPNNHTYVNAGVRYFTINSQSITPMHSVTNGSHVGYSYVTEKIFDVKNNENYRIENEFENHKSINIRNFSKDPCYQIYHPGHEYATAITKSKSSTQFNRDHMNGKPIRRLHYDVNGNLQRSHFFKYEIDYVDYFPSVNLTMGSGCGSTPLNHIALFNVYANEIKRYLLSKETVVEKIGGEDFITTKTYSYNNSWQLKTLFNEKPGIQEETRLHYIEDYNHGVVYNQSALMQSNIVGNPIKFEKILNGKLVDGGVLRYDQSGRAVAYFDFKVSTPALPGSHSQTVEVPPGYELEFSVNYLPGTNKVQTVMSRNAYPQTYIWGYQNLYPLARVIGMTYSQVASHYNVNQNLLNSTTNTTQIRSELENLKSAISGKGYFVEIFDYEPIIGMTMRTDPSGLSNFYRYDSHGRLSSILNTNNDALKVMEYHFSNQ